MVSRTVRTPMRASSCSTKELWGVSGGDGPRSQGRKLAGRTWWERQEGRALFGALEEAVRAESRRKNCGSVGGK
jgi:hypothetical protein